MILIRHDHDDNTYTQELVAERRTEYAVQHEGFVSEGFTEYEDALEERNSTGGTVIRYWVMKTEGRPYDPAQEDPFSQTPPEW